MKKKVKLFASHFLAIAMFAVLLSCGKQSVSSDVVSVSNSSLSENGTNVSEFSTTDEYGQTIYPLTVEDSNGNDVIIEKEPVTVVSVAPNLTEMMFELGAGDKLIARTDYCDYPEAALSLESIGDLYNPDIEKIISLNPDLVIVSSIVDSDNIIKLEDAGIDVLRLCEEEDINGVYSMIEKLGQVINRNEEASLVVEEMKNTIAEVESKVSSLDKPGVYYVVGFGEYGDYTATGDTFISGLIEAAGGDNIAKDSTGWSITFEEIVEADPDYIIISDDSKEEFINADNYKELRAVKEGNVFTIDINMLERQGVRNDDAIVILAGIFHPDAF